METGLKRFYAIRLDRDAASAGQAFGFEDVEATPGEQSRATVWMLSAGCFAVFMCSVIFTLA